MFLRAWCPGLYGASPAEGNHEAFLSELDVSGMPGFNCLCALKHVKDHTIKGKIWKAN